MYAFYMENTYFNKAFYLPFVGSDPNEIPTKYRHKANNINTIRIKILGSASHLDHLDMA